MSLAEALTLDRGSDLEAAASAYEEVLSSGDVSELVLLNLALLYWQATDPGLAAARRIEPDFMAIASRRCPELLDEAERRFPRSTAVRFWRRYIDWADLGQPFAREDCAALLREDPSELVPALYLFTSSHGAEAGDEARRLLVRARQDGTTGARYVASVLEGVMRRGGTRS